MSRTIAMDIPHQLGADQARRIVRQRLDSLTNQFRGKVNSSISWSGNEARIEAVAFGQSATGNVQIDDANVHIHVSLPWILSPMSGKIAGFLGGVAQDALRRGR